MMYRTNVRISIVAAILFASSSALAEDIKDIPPGEDVIEPVSKGQPAPFTGQLFDINTSLRWANWLTQYEAVLSAEMERSKAKCAADLEYQTRLGAIEIERLTVLRTDAVERLKRSETGRLQAEYERDNPPWHSSVWFGVVAGAVGAIGLMAAGAHAF